MNINSQSKASPIAGLLETGSFAGLGRLADKHRLKILSQEQHLRSALSSDQHSDNLSHTEEKQPKR